MKIKKLYKGVFNWKGELHTFHNLAYSESQAKQFMYNRLADKLKVDVGYVKGYFMFKGNAITMEEIKEKKR